MKVCSVISGIEGFRSLRGNARRLEVACSGLKWAAANGSDLMVFPAGYLRARSSATADLLDAAVALLAEARRQRVALVVGVDTCSSSWVDKSGRTSFIETSALPYFAIAWSPSLVRPKVWRQRSTTSGNWGLAPTERNAEVRTLPLGKTNVAVALCGEAFSKPVRDGIVSSGVKLVVLPAHVAGGLRHWRALSYFRDHGVPAVRAVHASGSAENLLWRGRSKVSAVSESATFIEGDFWGEAV